MVHIFTLHCASGVKTDRRRASGAKNSIEQHGVPAWPAGRPREYQHGLLVVQGSISMACWSSKGVSAWPAGRPSPACLNTRTFKLTSASPFSTHPFQHSTIQRRASPPVWYTGHTTMVRVARPARLTSDLVAGGTSRRETCCAKFSPTALWQPPCLVLRGHAA